MKTQSMLKIIRFCLPGVLAAAWWGTTLHAQEKPTILLWHNGELGQKQQLLDSSFSTPNRIIPDPKSEGTAVALSLGGTIVPITLGLVVATQGPNDAGIVPGVVLMGSGVVFGPSLGYFYGGRPGRGLSGIGIRLGLSAATLGATYIAGTSTDGWDGLDRAAVAFFIGSGVVAAAAVADVLLVPKAVRKHNRSLQEKALTIAPAYFAQHGAPGVKVQVQF
ncbi:MAG: hypothetical protein L0196_06060 [candidate division Zixibacteria bacterium]|nr:hypothetical protein [candidate division Zixibacteria bacterium]